MVGTGLSLAGPILQLLKVWAEVEILDVLWCGIGSQTALLEIFGRFDGLVWGRFIWFRHVLCHHLSYSTMCALSPRLGMSFVFRCRCCCCQVWVLKVWRCGPHLSQPLSLVRSTCCSKEARQREQERKRDKSVIERWAKREEEREKERMRKESVKREKMRKKEIKSWCASKK